MYMLQRNIVKTRYKTGIVTERLSVNFGPSLDNVHTATTVLRLVQALKKSESVAARGGYQGLFRRAIIYFNNQMCACRKIGGALMLDINFHY